jgi:hypothetical protein
MTGKQILEQVVLKRQTQIRAGMARETADVFERFLKEGRYTGMTGSQAVESVIAALRFGAQQVDPASENRKKNSIILNG